MEGALDARNNDEDDDDDDDDGRCLCQSVSNPILTSTVGQLLHHRPILILRRSVNQRVIERGKSTGRMGALPVIMTGHSGLIADPLSGASRRPHQVHNFAC